MSRGKRERRPAVTVLMRSKNSDWVIGQALAGLFSQDYRDFELVVVDSGSTDRTLDIIRQYPARLIQIESDSYYPGAVLNQAMEACHSELVVFQNSDSVPLFPRTLGRLVGAFHDPAVMAAFGRQVPRPDAEAWVRRDYSASFPETGPAAEWMTLSLPLAAMRKSAWREHPFYTEAWGSEDTEWGFWARNRGWKVAYVRDAAVMHSHNYTLRQLYGRRFIEGEADAFIYRGRQNWMRFLTRLAASCAHDLEVHFRHADWKGLARIPVRRCIDHWAYMRGHRWGEQRLSEGNRDVATGQRVVLERYEK